MTDTLADLLDAERRMIDAEVRDHQRPGRLRGELRHDAERAARRRLRAELDAELAAPLIGRGVLTDAERQAIRQSEFSRRRAGRDRVVLPK